MRRRLRFTGPFDLGLTMSWLRHGRGDPSIRLSPQEVWRATRTPLGAASLRIERRADEVAAEAWGPGAEWALEMLGDLVGAGDDPTRFEPDDRLVRRLHRRYRGLRFTKTRSVFEAMLPTVIAQKVTGKEARRSYHRLLQTHGEPAPGPGGLLLQPEAQTLAELRYEDYHPLGIEKRRADTIRRSAAGAGRLEREADSSDLLTRTLVAIPGVGPWTAAKVAQVAAGDADAVAVGDYHKPSLVAWNLAGEPRADDARMLELLEPYRGHRARVVRLLEVGGRTPPRFGPRVALRHIERF